MVYRIFGAVKEIFTGIRNEPSIIWYLVPIIFLWFLLEIYFGVYKKEKLGWNTALGNGITLMWICIESMRVLFLNKPGEFWIKFIVTLLMLCYALFIIYLSFSHRFSKRLTYLMASPTPIYYLCAMTLLWGHGLIKTEMWNVAAISSLFVLFVIIAFLFKLVLPRKTSLFELPEEEGMPEENGDFPKGLG